MDLRNALVLGTVVLMLAACGGGGSGDAAAGGASGTASQADAGSGGGTTPTVPNNAPAPNPTSPGDASATPPAATFAARLTDAPADGTFLGFEPYLNSATFAVEGALLGNVELVSALDERVIYGRFTISPDQTRATLDWRYRDHPYGSYALRIIAWDAPPGQAGQRIDVASRNYTVHLPLGCQAEGTCGMPAP